MTDSKCKVDIPVCHLPTREQTGMSVLHNVHKTRRHLPHWTADAMIYWVGFRLADSLPQDKLNQWREERDIWLRQNPQPWNDAQWHDYTIRFGARFDEWLDAGCGSCALARPEVRAEVRECILRFDGERLRVHAVVIMPNHVHMLIEPLGENKLSQLMKGIKGASARRTNQIMGTSGQFWRDESFDHIVRSDAQYHHYLDYIAQNPIKANLKEHEYWLQCKADIPVCHSNTPNPTNSTPETRQTGMSGLHSPEK